MAPKVVFVGEKDAKPLFVVDYWDTWLFLNHVNTWSEHSEYAKTSNSYKVFPPKTCTCVYTCSEWQLHLSQGVSLHLSWEGPRSQSKSVTHQWKNHHIQDWSHFLSPWNCSIISYTHTFTHTCSDTSHKHIHAYFGVAVCQCIFGS